MLPLQIYVMHKFAFLRFKNYCPPFLVENTVLFLADLLSSLYPDLEKNAVIRHTA